jgi:hypothetical protein
MKHASARTSWNAHKYRVFQAQSPSVFRCQYDHRNYNTKLHKTFLRRYFAIISLNNIIKLIFQMEPKCVSCEVRTKLIISEPSSFKERVARLRESRDSKIWLRVPAGLVNKNDRAGEGQQEFTSLTEASKSLVHRICLWNLTNADSYQMF